MLKVSRDQMLVLGAGTLLTAMVTSRLNSSQKEIKSVLYVQMGAVSDGKGYSLKSILPKDLIRGSVITVLSGDCMACSQHTIMDYSKKDRRGRLQVIICPKTEKLDSVKSLTTLPVYKDTTGIVYESLKLNLAPRRYLVIDGVVSRAETGDYSLDGTYFDPYQR